MQYTVTIVKDILKSETLFVAAHRASVEHMIWKHTIGPAATLRIIADGVLCAPGAFPWDLTRLAKEFYVAPGVLAEALEIDEAMRSKSEQGASHG